MTCRRCKRGDLAVDLCSDCTLSLARMAQQGRLGHAASAFSRLLHLFGWHDYNWAWPGYPVCVICGKVQGSHGTA